MTDFLGLGERGELVQLSPELKVGITVLLSLILLASMTMAIGRVDFTRSSSGYDLEVIYSTVDGLKEGAPVRFAGVNVGRVSFVDLESRGVRVGMRIEREELMIPADSRFVITSVGVLGDKHVEIHPGISQETLPDNALVAGVNPVMIDSVLVEMESTLHNLNSVIIGFAEITDSRELKDNIVESTTIMRNTIAGLQLTVDQVSGITGAVEEMVDEIGELTGEFSSLRVSERFSQVFDDVQKFSNTLAQVELEESVKEFNQFTKTLAELELKAMSEDMQVFTKNLAELDMKKPFNEMNMFMSELNEIPIKEITDELQTLTSDLSQLEIVSLREELGQFTGMLAKIDINPLVEEVSGITHELAKIDFASAGQEIELFTKRLAGLPLEEFSREIQDIATSIKQLPMEQIADELLHTTNELSSVPISEIATNLQNVSDELASIGWQEIAQDVSGFSSQLASLDLDDKIEIITADITNFSSQLAEVDAKYLFDELAITVNSIQELASSVKPEDVNRVVQQLERSMTNVEQTSVDFNKFINELNDNTSNITGETLVTIGKVQEVMDNVQSVVVGVSNFVDDFVDDGETASDIKETLAAVHQSSEHLNNTINLINAEIPLTADTFDDLKNTMTNIKEINEDIQNIRGMGETVKIESQWGLGYNLLEKRLAADIRFQFEPEDQSAFYVLGWSDIGEENNFQLQYGQESGNVRQRYGLIDTQLGIGLDGNISDQWRVSADLRHIAQPKLRLRADYQWLPDWWITLSNDDVFKDDGGINLGIEKRF